MKTTVELPDALAYQVKLRAENEGRKVTDVVADLLGAGLSLGGGDSPKSTTILTKNLPRIKVRPAQPDARKLTTQEWCDWIKDLDLQLEVERYEKAFGHQHVDRADG